jgi:predicted Ser/Thr protein kinase
MTPGSKLGPYEIVAPIGAGGMGEVYRARDSKLKRDVALKVLPAAFASDPDRMARFRREAELLASLNHPNIATIYGFQDNALVMELVEGPTLADRIKDRGIPLEEALKVARQIAEALEYAHDRGIIHRDLKPANVKVTPDGTAKVLDFGLAKAIEDPAPSASPADSPTITLAAATHAGVILGTAAYMSPEQAHGKNADRRADIWSFGALLYEMLTGEQAFKGESVSDTLASVLKLEPDWTPLPANTPAAIRKLLRRCLMKERKQRLQAIGEARIAIEESLSGVAEEPVATVSKKRSIVPWAIAGVLALVLLVVAGLQLYNATRPAPLRPLMRVNLVVDDSTPLARAGGGNMLALSPDSARLALTLRGADGKVRLYTRLLNHSQVTPLAGTDDASYPFFSPDGEWIGFFADGKLKKIAVEGGAALTLCDGPGPRGASWGDDGNIVAALTPNGVLSRVHSAGGTPVPVTKLNSGEATHRWPQVLPGSQAILFTAAAYCRKLATTARTSR